MSTPENIPSVGPDAPDPRWSEPDAPDPRWSEPETEPHAAPATPADEVVLERLREAMASVPGAGSVAALAKAAFAFRTMEAELAELESVDPETVAQGDLVGAERFRGEPRVLVFRTGPQQTEQTEQTEDGGSLGDARSPGWIEVEHVDGELKKVSLELLTAARALGEPSAVVFGETGTAAALTDALKEAGAEKIYVAEGDAVQNYLVTPKVDVLAGLAEQGAAAIVLAATFEGKEVAGRLAARTGSGTLCDVVEIKSDGSAVHSIFGGAFTVEATVSGETPIYTLRPGSVEAAPAAGAGEVVEVQVPEPENAAKVISRNPIVGGDRPELTEATVVVSGGRGVGSADNFEKVVEPLADSLKAAVGASRAAVDSGYYPGQFQVGQTGKTVSPQLYVACGISGAIQHRAGMQTSKTIVAVNKDEEAPIFEIADYGIVGDLFNVAPQLTEAINARK